MKLITSSWSYYVFNMMSLIFLVNSLQGDDTSEAEVNSECYGLYLHVVQVNFNLSCVQSIYNNCVHDVITVQA